MNRSFKKHLYHFFFNKLYGKTYVFNSATDEIHRQTIEYKGFIDPSISVGKELLSQEKEGTKQCLKN